MAESARRKKERPAGGEDDDLPPDQRVRVAVRIRPHNRADHGDASNCLSVSGQRITADSGQKSFSFSYDNVFHDANQEQVFILALVSAVLMSTSHLSTQICTQTNKHRESAF